MKANIKYVSGDLVASASCFDAIAHGCNAQGVMGSGIARQVRQQFPEAYRAYLNLHQEGLRLGDLCWGGDSPRVYNCITQEFYGRDSSKRYACPTAISISLTEMAAQVLAEIGEGSRIGLPLIGCGLGGLDWDSEVKEVYENLGECFGGLHFTVFEEFVPKKVPH